MESNRAYILVNKLIAGNASKAEATELYQLLEETAGREVIAEILQASFVDERYKGAQDEHHKARLKTVLLQRIAADEKKFAPVHSIRRFKWAAAAAVLVLMAGSVYFLLQPKPTAPVTVKVYQKDLAPGHAGGKMKLKSGRIILLDGLKDGLIAEEAGIKVFMEKGQVVYRGASDDATAYNEIIMDRGRETSAILPDGSTVWVNAGSSVRYPLKFSGGERLVTMRGEASFSVVHDAKRPFRVQVKDQLVEDIGTEFNINAYDDEAAVVTTLVEGTASVSSGRNKMVVHAGSEARQTAGQLTVVKADVEKAIAWRKGTFRFTHATIPEMMRQLSRWYDVEVAYEGAIPDETFTGDIERSFTLAQAMKVIEKMSAHFRIEEGRKVVIVP